MTPEEKILERWVVGMRHALQRLSRAGLRSRSSANDTGRMAHQSVAAPSAQKLDLQTGQSLEGVMRDPESNPARNSGTMAKKLWSVLMSKEVAMVNLLVGVAVAVYFSYVGEWDGFRVALYGIFCSATYLTWFAK